MVGLLKPGRAAKARAGFTLIEIVIVILALGVLATIAIPRFGDMIGGSKTATTRDEMRTLKIALVGSGKNNVRGYENDVGSLPSGLADLTSKPGGVGNWDRFTKTGWNGPYIDSTGGDYLRDGWGTNYIYNQAGRSIKSVGSGDTITVNF
ncbi:MAG: prepilin-type N-terminal cleavage/methylation domain-containing protein [candidate division Zixibacteria bacterium]|nr:prepilin-type N-terminal cleavage/methylation domain-containing protein [candidate division Zixibacteria bacterium]